jgi:hypothetical protein
VGSSSPSQVLSVVLEDETEKNWGPTSGHRPETQSRTCDVLRLQARVFNGWEWLRIVQCQIVHLVGCSLLKLGVIPDRVARPSSHMSYLERIENDFYIFTRHIPRAVLCCVDWLSEAGQSPQIQTPQREGLRNPSIAQELTRG